MILKSTHASISGCVCLCASFPTCKGMLWGKRVIPKDAYTSMNTSNCLHVSVSSLKYICIIYIYIYIYIMLHCFYLHTRDVWTYINIHICKHVKTLPSRKLCSKLYECIRRDFRKQSLNPLRSACMRVCVCVCVCMHARVCVCVYVSWDVSICVLFMFINKSTMQHNCLVLS